MKTMQFYKKTSPSKPSSISWRTHYLRDLHLWSYTLDLPCVTQ